MTVKMETIGKARNDSNDGNKASKACNDSKDGNHR